MTAPVKLGIIGLGRWAKVLTRASVKSSKFKIVSGFSRAADKRAAFEQEFGVKAAPDMKTLLADPEIKGVILTVPNEQHLPLADRGRQGRQARLHRKADRLDARGRARSRGLGKAPQRHRHRRPQRPPDGRHPHDPRGDRRRRARPGRLHGSRISPTSARSSSPRRPGAGTRPRRRAGRCRSSPSIISTFSTISAARSRRRARWPPSCRRSAPRSTTSR